MQEKERLARLARAWISHVHDLCAERKAGEHCWAADPKFRRLLARL